MTTSPTLADVVFPEQLVVDGRLAARYVIEDHEGEERGRVWFMVWLPEPRLLASFRATSRWALMRGELPRWSCRLFRSVDDGPSVTLTEFGNQPTAEDAAHELEKRLAALRTVFAPKPRRRGARR